MRFITAALLGCAIALPVTRAMADTKPEAKKEEMVCVSNTELNKVMEEKGYVVLLSMRNDDKVVETIWAGGQSITITAAVPNQDKSCLLAMMDNVHYNPNAIEGIWEVYKKQTKQKEI